MVGTTWSNHRVWRRVKITTDESGLEEIEKDPLQDYLHFGVKTINYVYFDVYEELLVETRKNTIIICSKEPIKKIEAGEYCLTRDEEKLFLNDTDVLVLNY